MPKTAALCAAVFQLSAKNLRGVSKHHPPARRAFTYEVLSLVPVREVVGYPTQCFISNPCAQVNARLSVPGISVTAGLSVTESPMKVEWSDICKPYNQYNAFWGDQRSERDSEPCTCEIAPGYLQ